MLSHSAVEFIFKCFERENFRLNLECLNEWERFTHSPVTQADYFDSEVIQSVFRTRARLGKPVDIAVTMFDNELKSRAYSRLSVGSSYSNQLFILRQNIMTSSIRADLKNDMISLVDLLREEQYTPRISNSNTDFETRKSYHQS